MIQLFEGTNLSTVIRDGKEMRPVNPLDQSSPWMTDDGSDDIPAENIAEDMSRIGADLAILQLGNAHQSHSHRHRCFKFIITCLRRNN